MCEKQEKSQKRKLIPENATRQDHQLMIHWLWSSERNGLIYLELSDKFWRGMLQSTWEDSQILEQAKYHFVSTLGYLLRVLEESVQLFPQLLPAYQQAGHIRDEGKNLRDMIEHAYGGKSAYLDGTGKKQDEFIREAGDVLADATSVVITDRGHMLGNRLCIELALQEIERLRAAAARIDPPNEVAP